MADRMIGLCGPGKGPMVPTYNRPSRARITGMDGGSVTIAAGENIIPVTENGIVDLPSSSFVQFEYDGESKGLCCEVLRNAL